MEMIEGREGEGFFTLPLYSPTFFHRNAHCAVASIPDSLRRLWITRQAVYAESRGGSTSFSSMNYVGLFSIYVRGVEKGGL